MIDKLFFAILVLNATGLFRFLAPQLGVDIWQVSTALLVLHAVYLLARRRYFVKLLHRTGLKYWLFVLILWPFVTVFYAPVLDVRQIGLQIYFASLFCGTVVYAMANGIVALHRVITVSLVVSIFGIALSLIEPSCFEEVARLTESRTAYTGRAFGFFMQPNRAATGIVLLFLSWYSLWKGKNQFRDLAVIAVFLTTVLFTGSRSMAVMAIAVCALTVAHRLREGFNKGVRHLGHQMAKAFLMIACLVVLVTWLNHYASAMDDVRGGLFNRIRLLTSFRLSESSIIKEKSVQQRLNAQKVYWSLICEKPLLGHGLGSDAYYKQIGPIFLSAHSGALTCAMEYGVFYPIAFYLIIFQLYWTRGRSDVESIFQTNSIEQFVFVVVILFSINGVLLENRTFYVVWGMLFATVCCPKYLFRYDERTGRIAGVLACRKIAGRTIETTRPREASKPSISAVAE